MYGGSGSERDIQAPDLRNGTIVAITFQESHYLSTESVVIDR